MARPRNFSRQGVLEKALPVFWERGFADTTLQISRRLRASTSRVFMQSFEIRTIFFLKPCGYYIETSEIKDTLTTEPLGWDNICSYLNAALKCVDGQKGCFSTNSMRELAILPTEALSIVQNSLKPLRQLLVRNIEVERPRMPAGSLADIVMTFFVGVSLEQNLATTKTAGARKIEGFMQILRSL